MNPVVAQTAWLFALRGRNYHGGRTTAVEMPRYLSNLCDLTLQRSTLALRSSPDDELDDLAIGSTRSLDNNSSSETVFDTVIIGAGWAGLAAGKLPNQLNDRCSSCS